MLLALALANTLRTLIEAENLSLLSVKFLVCADTALRRFAMRSI
jgi:hypothetical protein